MNLNLGDTPFATRGYGVQSWNQLARSALERWNQVGIGPGEDHLFFAVRSPTVNGNACGRDGINEVRFATTFCGLAWGDTIGITVTRSVNARVVETDILFNATIPIDAYPGPIVSVGSRPLVDFFRLALHEFGHATGLDHPNDAGQLVDAIMNAGVNQRRGATIDSLQPDDIAGAHAVAWGSSDARLSAFVRGLYEQVLARTPADAEVGAWVAFLRAHPDAIGARTLVHAFFGGLEALTRPRTPDDYVRLLYTALLGRPPGGGEAVSWVAAVLDRFNRLIDGFVSSAEFAGLAGRRLPDIPEMYAETLGRTPSADEVAAWFPVVDASPDWQALGREFLNSPEYLGIPRTLSEHVSVLYRTFLDRSPSPDEVDAWVNVLVAELGGIGEQFVVSPEFRARFLSLF
jgi:hypothetical protein